MRFGVFDSGVGGLTVVKEIKKQFPQCSIVYFGDLGRTPYGTKSKYIVKRYSQEICNFLLTQKVDLIVIACNTASSVCADDFKNKLPVRVYDVIKPAVEACLKDKTIKKIGIIGTKTTIRMGAYEKLLKEYGKEIYPKACSLFVPVVEEGWIEHPIVDLLMKEYLFSFKELRIDALILACTHFPILKNKINEFFKNSVKLIDTAYEVARKMKEDLEKHISSLKNEVNWEDIFFVSDEPDYFLELANKFLDLKIEESQVYKKVF